MENRFQHFQERFCATSLPWQTEFWKAIKDAKWSTNGRVGVTWRGIRVLKDPFTLSLLSGLLWELKPRTVLEFGSFEGGSALWIADMAAAMRVETKVLSYDIAPEKVKVSHPAVTFSRLDVNSIERDLDLESLQPLPRPFLVIEDVHKNVFAVLEHVSKLLTDGDYLVVEDTCEPEKYKSFSRFMYRHSESLLIDAHYADNFGYNASWNWNSFLRKMS